MRIVIPGGSGQVGTVLARAFQRAGHEVVVLSRRAMAAPWRVIPWDGAVVGPWAEQIDDADVVINLAGQSVNCRYSPANRALIMNSRVQSTRAVGQAIARATRPPRIWLQASTATIYAHRYESAHDEATGIIGGNEPDAPHRWHFSIEVVCAWERALDEVSTPGTRKVKLRSAVIMNADAGSIFDVLLGLVRRGLGGQAGNGRQFVSWIHHEDFVRALHWIMDHDQLADIVNVAAPNPLPNREFMHVLRAAQHSPIGLPAPRWLLEIGALLMKSETELVLKSRRVVPGRLLESGLPFGSPPGRRRRLHSVASGAICGVHKGARRPWFLQSRAETPSTPSPAPCVSA